MTSPVLGLSDCALSSFMFGSFFVPVQRHDSGNGIFVQWVMCSAIFMVGLVVFAIEGFPQFQPLAMLGGVFWCVGNISAVPTMNILGLGMATLLWGITTCVSGWAIGRFGLFGIKATIPSMPLLNYVGLTIVLIAGYIFSRVKTNPKKIGDHHANDDDEERLVHSEHRVFARKYRSLAFIVSLIAGIFYGVTFVPVIYMQDHPELYPDASREGLAYVFSHFTGIFATATIIFIVYVLYARNKPVINNEIAGPSFVAGIMWGVAQTAWFVANDNLSQTITFPIICMVPGACGAIWGVFYFREIEGRRNLRLLWTATAMTLLGATLVGLS